MGTTKIVLLRHGKTEWNLNGKLQGRSDSPLTSEAIEQAHATGRRLKHSALAPTITRVFTSPLLRAARTAQLIIDGLGDGPSGARAPEPRGGLTERSFGCWEGKTWAQVGAESPEQLAAYKGGDLEWCIPGGESNGGAARRFVGALTAIAERHVGETVVVVAHSNVMSQFVRVVLQLRDDAERRFGLENEAVNIVVWRSEKRRFELELLGDTGPRVGYCVAVKRDALVTRQHIVIPAVSSSSSGATPASSRRLLRRGEGRRTPYATTRCHPCRFELELWGDTGQLEAAAPAAAERLRRRLGRFAERAGLVALGAALGVALAQRLARRAPS